MERFEESCKFNLHRDDLQGEKNSFLYLKTLYE